MKGDMRKLHLLLLSLSFSSLGGCQSEIDKCANAMLRDHPHKTEAQARLLCLQAASGNKN
jgi:hypothetical protein